MNNNEKYEFLLSAVRQRLDDYRYSHVLSVFEECTRLCNLFELSATERDDLLTAAIFHDITKSHKASKQAELAKELGLTLEKDDLESPATLHAITGATLIATEFAQFSNEEICSAVLCHTVGREGMTIVEKLLYLADYIEPSRTFKDCVSVRDHFYSQLGEGVRPLSALDSALLLSFDLTIGQLMADKCKIHPQTIRSRNYLIK